MNVEIEAKWTNINHADFREKLKKAGAKLVTPMRQMTREVFDFEDGSLQKKTAWVRLRDEGDKITLSYKQLDSRDLQGTKEVQLVVDTYNSARDFLNAIGLKTKSKQETRRETWELDGAEIALDEWPWVPTFIEIESQNADEMARISAILDLDMKDALFGSVEPVYQKYYDITEAEINAWPEITFSPVPDWLEKTRKVRGE
jgi:adenylate cyclase class 2